MTTRTVIRQSLSAPLSIGAILTGALTISAIVLLAGYMLRGPSPMFDLTTLLLSLAMISLLGLFLGRARGPMFAQAAVLTFYFLLFVLPRVAQYLLIPDLLSLPYSQETRSGDINVGQAYLLLGTIAIIGGFVLAGRWVTLSGPEQREASAPEYPLPAILGILALVLPFEFYITFGMNIGVFGNYRAEVGNTFIQLLRSLLSVDMAFFVILTSIILASQFKNRAAMGGMLIIIFLLYMSLLGSRVGGLRVVSMVLPILLVSRGNFRVSLLHVAGFLLFVTALNVGMFPVGTQTRNDMVARHLEDLERNATTVPPDAVDSERRIMAQSMQSGTDAIVQTIRRAREGVMTAEGLDLYAKPTSLIMAIVDRMGAVDYTVQVLTHSGDKKAMAKFMDFGYAAKSIINTFTPGAPFPDAELSTSRSPSVIYRGLRMGHLSGYFSEYWTAWGLAFAMLGWWGGLVGLLVAGFVIHAGYLAILRVAQGYRYHLGALWLFIVSLHFYLTMGLDHSVTTAVVTFLQAGVALAAVHGLALVATTKAVPSRGSV